MCVEKISFAAESRFAQGGGETGVERADPLNVDLNDV
jgi:hypothetical protein